MTPIEPPKTDRTLIKLAIIAAVAWIFWKIVSFVWRTARVTLGVGLYIACFLLFWTGIIAAFVEGKPEYAVIALVFLPGCWLAMWVSGLFKGALVDA